jgi:hypothetical protein
VTRLGKISPFGRYFLALGAFFSEKYCPNDLGAIFSKISPKFHINMLYILTNFLSKNSQILTKNFFGKKFLFNKAPSWAIFQQNWAHFFHKTSGHTAIS